MPDTFKDKPQPFDKEAKLLHFRLFVRMTESWLNTWQRAFARSLPVAAGYYPAGMAFGVLAAAANLPFWLSLLLSVVLYSGAAQYAAIPLLAAGVDVIGQTINAFIINLRHIFYGIPLMSAAPSNKLARFYAFFALTDESFSILTSLPEHERAPLWLKIVFFNQFYWVSATIIGFLLGDWVSRYLAYPDFALVCLFAMLAYEQWQARRQLNSILLAITAFFIAHALIPHYVLLCAVSLCVIITLFASFQAANHSFSLPKQQILLPTWLFITLAFIGYDIVSGSIASQTVALVQAQQTAGQQIMAVFAMGAATFLLRFAPNILPRVCFDSPHLKQLNNSLPLAVMIILLLASLDLDNAFSGSLNLLIAQCLALLPVWLIYRAKRNVLLGMVAGVATLNILLWLM